MNRKLYRRLEVLEKLIQYNRDEIDLCYRRIHCKGANSLINQGWKTFDETVLEMDQLNLKRAMKEKIQLLKKVKNET